MVRWRVFPLFQVQNPVYGAYFADPFVFEHSGIFYAIGTGPVRDGEGVFPVLTSSDMQHWEPKGGALVPLSPECGTDYWAPEVTWADGKFYLYYSVGFGDQRHQLRVAVADTPEGPYRDVGEPLLSLADCPFAIDAHPFQDGDGQWYLFYARDFLDTDRPGTSLVVARLNKMTNLDPEWHLVARAGHDWQRYEANREIYGGRLDWHTLEGPCVWHIDGRYYCLYSGGNWQNDTYGLDYVEADSVLGPYADTNSSMRPRVLQTIPGRVIGPGHNSLVMAPDHETKMVAYHAWDSAMTSRRMCLDPLVLTADGPRCLGPTWSDGSY